MRTLVGYACVALGILLAAWRLQTPAPVPADAPASVFSAARAFADIRVIARRPHPVGSAEHDVVRDYLVGRLERLGLAPQIRFDRSITVNPDGGTIIAPVANIVATLPGKNRGKPALFLMSHYDTVPNSPGAADDTAGIATALEIARALKAGPRLERDAIFVFTDAEELGMMGAAVFFERDPLARRGGAAINFEARGDAGLASMFETGPSNADTVAIYAAGAKRPDANSLSRVVYKHMPNGTDFTLAAKRGLAGLNFAFIGDEAAYHSPLATPAHLNLGSVQHMGDQALGAARGIAAAMPQQKADAVYFDVFGFFLIQYSFVIGWVLLLVAAALAIYAIWKARAPVSWGRGFAGALLLLLAPALLLWTAGRWFEGIDHFQRLAHFDFLLAGAASLAVGSAGLAAAAVENGRGRLVLMIGAVAAAALSCLAGFDWVSCGLAACVLLLAWASVRRTARPAALWQAALIVVLLLATALQLFVPEAAFALTWPLLAAALVAAVRFGSSDGHPAVAVFAVVAAFVVAAQAAVSGAAIFTAVGVDMPVTMMLPLLAALPVLLLLPGQVRHSLWTHAVVIAAGVALFGYGRLAPPTAEQPSPGMVRHVQDLDNGKAYRVAGFDTLDEWTRAALGDGKPRFEPLPWTGTTRWWWTPVKAATVPLSTIDVRSEGSRLLVAVKAAPGAYLARLEVRPAERLTHGAVDGRALKGDLKPGEWNQMRFYAPGPEGFAWGFDAPAHGKLEIRLTTTYLDWPKDAPPLPAMPANRMAFGTSGGTQTITGRTWQW